MKTDKQYWFKRRRYGWGWFPASWQGWAVFTVFIGVLVVSGLVLLPGAPRNQLTNNVLMFLAIMFTTVLVLIAVALVKGPKPHWRWGKKSSDDPDEDW